MKAITWRAMSNGVMDYVDLSNRILPTGSEQSIYSQSKIFAAGRLCEVSIWSDEDFYVQMEPSKTYKINGPR